jgi:hypothetical protein
MRHYAVQVDMGRDHTIYATAPGFVRFYKTKWMSGERKFIGVVLNRGDKLPRDEESLGRSRFFGLVNTAATASAFPVPAGAAPLVASDAAAAAAPELDVAAAEPAASPTA